MKCGVQCTFNVQCDVMRKMCSATIQCNAIYWAAVTAVQLLYDKNKQLILLNFCHFDFPRQISERHVNCHSNAQDISWQSTLVYKTLRNNPSEGPTQYNSSLCSDVFGQCLQYEAKHHLIKWTPIILSCTSGGRCQCGLYYTAPQLTLSAHSYIQKRIKSADSAFQSKKKCWKSAQILTTKVLKSSKLQEFDVKGYFC